MPAGTTTLGGGRAEFSAAEAAKGLSRAKAGVLQGDGEDRWEEGRQRHYLRRVGHTEVTVEARGSS